MRVPRPAGREKGKVSMKYKSKADLKGSRLPDDKAADCQTVILLSG